MHNPDKPFELRNIKKNPSGYQIQFIVKGKSYSDFSTDLAEAIKIRNKMEKKLKLAPKGAFRTHSPKTKLSFIPGTNKLMAPGITIYSHKRTPTRSESYSIAVNWRDHTGKARIKCFYGCTESCYSRKKLKETYDRALEFRKSYEKAVLENTLASFDPSAFNKPRVKKTERNRELLKKHLRRRR